MQQQQAQAQGFVTLALAVFEQGQETKSHLLNQIPTKPNNIQKTIIIVLRHTNQRISRLSIHR
ncbi:MAG: hypothetical protein HC862_20420 [Scytonema sp. RU_4_4]|nr:hypothetical protein [Scytonema sp. RU_4_4]